MLTDVLNQFAASRPEGQLHSDLPQRLSTKLPRLLQLAEEAVDKIPLIRKMVAMGIAPIVGGHFALEGKVILSAVFAGSFKRCALLWKLLLKELDTSSCPQRLLLKLEYCQKFCIRAFNSSPLDNKRLLVSENAASITFALGLSIAILQGKSLLCTLNDYDLSACMQNLVMNLCTNSKLNGEISQYLITLQLMYTTIH